MRFFYVTTLDILMAGFDIERILGLLQNGEPALAEQECRRRLHDDPDSEALLSVLGIALHQQGQAGQSSAIYERLTWLYPAEASHWNNYGTVLREIGQLSEAESAYLAALKISPDDAAVLANLGLLHKQRADYVSARTFLLRALRGTPDDDAQTVIYAAMACYECGDNKTVQGLISGWRKWLPLGGDLRLDLAWLLAQMGHTEDAEYLLDQSLSTDVAGELLIRARVRKVLLLERVNRLDEAQVVLSTLPDPSEIADQSLQNEVIGAMGVLAQRGSNSASTRQLLERLLEFTVEPRNKSNLYFALAKACDKSGDHQAVLAALARGHLLQVESAAQLAPELLLPEVQPLAPALIRMTAEQASGWIKPMSGEVDRLSPIFVVGFPRSGTTMLEQILDAHPSLVSMDEQPFLQAVSDRFVEQGFLYPEGLGELDAEGHESLVQYYWDQVRAVATVECGQRLVDKNPLNLLHLPLICRLFPDAPLVLALRHPCDVIFSCYMQNFRSPGFQILCSTLDRLARGYVNAMQYWIYHEKLLNPRVLHLSYEDLLDDFDGQVERLGRFIAIDDTSSMKNFHQHALKKGFISTPSYSQVTKPPNKAAVGRWQRYEEAFIPILPILNGVMEHWGYVDNKSN